MKISDPTGKNKVPKLDLQKLEHKEISNQQKLEKALKEDSGKVSDTLKKVEQVIEELKNGVSDSNRVNEVRERISNKYDLREVARKIVQELF